MNLNLLGHFSNHPNTTTKTLLHEKQLASSLPLYQTKPASSAVNTAASRISTTMHHPIVFQNALRAILGLTRELAESTVLGLCRAHIGVSFEVCADVWKKIMQNDTMPSGAQPKHLLWALMMLNMYATSKQRAVTARADPKTCDKWVWAMLEAIVSIKSMVVSYH